MTGPVGGAGELQTICRKLDAVAQHLNMKGRPQSLDIATAVRLVEEAAEWAAKHIEERGRELDKLRATLNKVAKDIDGTSPNGESIARERIQSVLREAAVPKPAPPAPDDKPTPCERCHGEVGTVWVPTGFSGESEPLCGKCVSVMLGEAHELMEQAKVQLRDRHASAERVRELLSWLREMHVRYKDKFLVYGEIADRLERALPSSTGEKS